MHHLVLSWTSIEFQQRRRFQALQLLNWDGAFMLSRSPGCPVKWTHPAKNVEYFYWSQKLVAKSGNEMKTY